MTSLGSLAFVAAVTVCTWNGEWFPSGRAEHRAEPEVEAGTIREAGRMLREGLAKVDPAGTNDLVFCFNEIRDPHAARLLCEAIGRTNLAVAVVTDYRRRDRFDMQQDVIATTLPVAAADWSRWKTAKDETPPRGYARAQIVFSPAVTATVYSVHLKSNYGQTTEEAAALNRAKRDRAVRQLVEQETDRKGRPKGGPVIVAGDFNADAWARSFADDTIFDLFGRASFSNVLELIPDKRRVTHPGRGRWGDTALDYIMVRGLEVDGKPVVHPADRVSDHRPVFVNIVP